MLGMAKVQDYHIMDAFMIVSMRYHTAFRFIQHSLKQMCDVHNIYYLHLLLQWYCCHILVVKVCIIKINANYSVWKLKESIVIALLQTSARTMIVHYDSHLQMVMILWQNLKQKRIIDKEVFAENISQPWHTQPTLKGFSSTKSIKRPRNSQTNCMLWLTYYHVFI